MAYTTIDDPSAYFHTQLYTGGGDFRDITNDANAGNFKPDYIWTKARGDNGGHTNQDSNRGAGKQFYPNLTYQEENVEGVRAFLTNGFSLGSNGTSNANNVTHVAWQWKCNGGTTASNTDGTITSTVQANTTAGFSIITYTGTGTNGATVGHGLSKAPEMIIIRNRDANSNWPVYHYKNTSAPETDYLKLDETNATADNAGEWNDTAPTSSVFTLGTDADLNTDGDKHIAYCFHSVDGYSKMGSYEGNNSADGTFVYTGFKPMLVVVKDIDSSGSWRLQDTKRTEYNGDDVNTLQWNSSAAEYNTDRDDLDLDFLSNGFKHRSTYSQVNAARTYIYIAFAETPFKYSNAR